MWNDEIRDRLLASLELAHERFQRREAMAWLVLCYDEEPPDPEDGRYVIVGAYGPFASPEEALVECGKHDASSGFGFRNEVVPLYPPVAWKDGK
jgi:hypothetical protein